MAAREADPSFISVPDPEDGLRILLPNGQNIIDFEKGRVERGDGTRRDLKGSLQKAGADAARSFFGWIDNDALVRVDNAKRGFTTNRFFFDQCTYLIIEDWPYTKLYIEPKGGFDVRVYGVASTLPTVPFDRFPVTTHMSRNATGVGTADSWETVLGPLHMLNFNRKLFRLRNRSGGNDVDVRLQRSIFPGAGSLGWNTVATALSANNNAVAPGGEFVHDTVGFAHVWRVQVQNATAGSSSTVDTEAGGVTG